MSDAITLPGFEAPPSDERAENDWYRTPEWVIERFLAAWAPAIDPPGAVLEPCAGDGALLGPLRRHFPDATLDAFDIAPRHPAVREKPFHVDTDKTLYDVVLTNPPFSGAEEIVHYGLAKLRPGGHLALLLRLGFLASAGRRELYRSRPPVAVYVLPERPSFRNGTTDFAEYCWVVWRDHRASRPKQTKLYWL